MCTLSKMNLTSEHKKGKIINYGFYFFCFSVCCKLSMISMYCFYNQNTNVIYTCSAIRYVIKMYPLKTGV